MQTEDTVLAAVCFVCFAVGIPTNIVALRYFWRQTQNITTSIYIAVAALDTFTSVMVFPVGLTLANRRKSMMFSGSRFCTFWGVTWEFIPYYTVFLVLCLSIVRCVLLMKPLVTISRKLVLGVLIGYAGFLALRQLLGVLLGYSHYQYDQNSGYCWNHIANQNYQVSDVIFSMLQVMFPILPILACSITSTTALIVSKKATRECTAVTRRKNDATITIILVTLIYIFCSIPAVLNYTRYVVGVYITGRDFLAESVGSNGLFLQKFIWLISFVIMVAINSLANPLLYIMRMKGFRSESLRIFSKTESSGLVDRAV